MLVQDMNVPIVEPDVKKDRIKILVDYFTINRNNHTFYALKFFLCEFLNFVNVLGQIYFMDFFLGGELTSLYIFLYREDHEFMDDTFPSKIYII